MISDWKIKLDCSNEFFDRFMHLFNKLSLKLPINIINLLEIAADYIIQKSTAVKTSDCP